MSRSPLEVRHSMLRLPAAEALLLQRSPEVQHQRADLLWELGTQAEQQAEQRWHERKAPVAIDFRAVAVYARHRARILAQK